MQHFHHARCKKKKPKIKRLFSPLPAFFCFFLTLGRVPSSLPCVAIAVSASPSAL